MIKIFEEYNKNLSILLIDKIVDFLKEFFGEDNVELERSADPYSCYIKFDEISGISVYEYGGLDEKNVVCVQPLSRKFINLAEYIIHSVYPYLETKVQNISSTREYYDIIVDEMTKEDLDKIEFDVYEYEMFISKDKNKFGL